MAERSDDEPIKKNIGEVEEKQIGIIKNLIPPITLIIVIFLFWIVQFILKITDRYNSLNVLFVTIIFAPFLLIFFGRVASQIVNLFTKGSNIPLITYDYILGRKEMRYLWYRPDYSEEILYHKKEVLTTILKLYLYYFGLSLLFLFLIRNSFILIQSDIYLNDIQIVILACLIAFMPRIFQLFNPALSRRILISIFIPLAVFAAPNILLYQKEIQIFNLSELLACIIISGLYIILGDFAADIAKKLRIVEMDLNVNTIATFPLLGTIKIKKEQFDFFKLAEIYVETLNRKRSYEGTIIENNLYEAYRYGNRIKNTQFRLKLINSIVYICEKGKGEHFINLLLDAYRDEDPNVEWVTGIAMDRCGDTAVEPLIKALNHNDSLIRCEAVGVLGRIGDKRAVEPIITLLNEDDLDVIEGAATALGKIGELKAVDPLIKTLNNDNPEIKMSAAQALGLLGDGRAIEPLLIMMKGDNNSDVRRVAAYALGNIGDSAFESLIETLNNEKIEIRINSILALKKIGDHAVRPLFKILKEDSNSDVKRIAASVLGDIGDASFKLLIESLHKGDSNFKANVIYALGNIGNVKAVEPIIVALKDESENVQLNAVKALGNIGDVKAVKPLIGSLNDDNKYLRESVIEALGNIGDARAVEPLIEHLHDDDPDIRQCTVRALGKIGDIRALKPLSTLTKDKIFYVRSSAQWAITKIKFGKAQEVDITPLMKLIWKVSPHLKNSKK